MQLPLIKRSIDVLASSLALLLLSPVIAVTWALVLWRLGSPALFVQERAGKGGEAFNLIKFRTMLDETDSGRQEYSDDDRLTPFGRALRSTSLDELPELWNVLRGEMSLVGPRPLLMEYLPLYTSEQMRRHSVRPGITGWAQINGRNDQTWEDRFALDLWYVDNHSLWLDAKIMLLTLLRVLRRDGINASGHATMARFTGTDRP